MPFHIDTIEKRIERFSRRKQEIEELLGKAGIKRKKRSSTQDDHSFQYNGASLKDLKVACVMDGFTLDSFSPECVLFEVTPSNWMQEIQQFQPDLLFVESVWHGKDKLWYRKIDRYSKELFEMATYCQSKGIPIVFWNKEDPIYTDSFMATARMADFVFTTDSDCVEKYKETLNHNRVYHLHFAAQPNTYNPIEKYERKDKFCFAGAYYQRYKERCKVFDNFAKVFIKLKGLDIFDRNYKKSTPEYAFPDEYRPYIKGRLGPEKIDIAYKGYFYGVNMNSVSQSQTMFARRAFEMLASNTVTVGNYSRGMKNYFGDLTICTDDNETLLRLLGEYCSDTETYRKYRLQGLRKVLKEHLYEDRLGYIVEKVFRRDLKTPPPQIHVIGFANNKEDVAQIEKSFIRQSYPNKELCIICDFGYQLETENVRVLSSVEAQAFDLSDLKDEFITLFSPDDYYGPNYLTDLALTTRYGCFSGIGKANYFYVNGEDILLDGTENTYKTVLQLSLERAIIKQENLPVKNFMELRALSSIEGESFFSVDEFNYCRGYIGDRCERVEDLFGLDQGLELTTIQKSAEDIQTNNLDGDATVIRGEEMLRLNMQQKIKDVDYEILDGKLVIESNLPEKSHQYIYMNEILDIDPYIVGGKMLLRFNGNGDLDITGVCVLFDGEKKKLSPIFAHMNHQVRFDIPEKARYFRLGLRLKGPGKAYFTSIYINNRHQLEPKNSILVKPRILVLTNHYPSKKNLYRNMFVHRRLRAYKQEGYHCDVMRMDFDAKDCYREFDGIDVIEGQGTVLANILESGSIDTVCVHFLNEHMWSVVKGFVGRIRLIIWCHGYEIQPWWRRDFNNATDSDREKAKAESDARMALWNEVFAKAEDANIHFVFVSKLFAESIMEDYNIRLSPDKYSVIHNCIDTGLFEYIPKPVEQRYRILTIKSFSSRTYANDLTTKAILELSGTDIFSHLRFDIYGDGPEFDAVNAPLKKFKNVHLHKRFISQQKIAQLHKTHGVFIATTRMDTHGVSRDEAMSSGLVAITNNVAAIPEFVDDDCGILVPAEDYKGIAAGIVKLCNDPAYFERLSANAAARVRRQTAKEYTIKNEITLIARDRS